MKKEKEKENSQYMHPPWAEVSLTTLT